MQIFATRRRIYSRQRAHGPRLLMALGTQKERSWSVTLSTRLRRDVIEGSVKQHTKYGEVNGIIVYKWLTQLEYVVH